MQPATSKQKPKLPQVAFKVTDISYEDVTKRVPREIVLTGRADDRKGALMFRAAAMWAAYKVNGYEVTEPKEVVHEGS